ncbi:SGNH/GDSL hydrolase family protein [Nocardioides speluncae]|uniref:SGNH/GDSL hydrolase family protein n=1 Tax=Nocardioides speluncae TaxID=2670337 RepID=UPI000D6939AC|nr:SGNH/GDSL hydrolase family protein [Nocardioides speluncae]
MGWGVRRGVVLAVLLTAACVGSAAADDAAQRCADIAARSEERARVVTGSGAPVLVIGDSYAMGSDLDDPARSWPAYLDGQVRVDGFAGSGFSRSAGPCRGVAYADRARRDLARWPGMIVVQGGLNDYDVPAAQVEADARRLLRTLAGRDVVLVGPAAAPARQAGAYRVDTVLARLAALAGVPYISTASWELDYLPDRLHLTPEGHRDFGERDATALRELTGVS